MKNRLYQNIQAEHEANAIAVRFMDSADIIGDMGRVYGRDLSDVRIHTDEAAARRVDGTGRMPTRRDVISFLDEMYSIRRILPAAGCWHMSWCTPCSNPA